jgi:fructokinase
MSQDLCIFGEVLFDIFADGPEVLGGAPFNVAWHLQAFGQAPFFISRVGNDPQGILIRKTMLDWGMDTRALATDDELPTGIVNITLADGEPCYDIVEPSAYDNIDLTTLPDHCSFLYHGSLALRNQQSRQALQRLLSLNPGLVFVDVNLRSPWWDKAFVLNSLQQADWVKLNTEELNQLYAADRKSSRPLPDFIRDYQLQGVLLTHGAKGAEILTNENEHYFAEPDQGPEIVDTVGAGDAFSAVIIMGLKNEWPLSITIQRAQQFASSIVSQRGATVKDSNFYTDFLKEWELT